MVRDKINVYMVKFAKIFSFSELYVGRFVLVLITICCALYAGAGIWILYNRPDETTITTQEVALITAFAGVNGFAYAISKKKDRGGK